MIFGLRLMFTLCTLVASLLFLSSPPEALAYSSETYTYPKDFDNNVLGTNNNDMDKMDAVYFGGRQLVMFTVMSSDEESYNSKIWFYTPAPEYNQAFDIDNSMDAAFTFKTCVYNNLLYIFYTPRYDANGYKDSKIYYRTVSVDRGDLGQDWELVMSDKKSISAGHDSAIVRGVAMMNGVMYIIYTSGKDWYYISSTDGLAFGAGTLLLDSSDSIRGAGIAVFQVPGQAEGERMLIAYATKGIDYFKYFFFDGTNSYGFNYDVAHVNAETRSIRLITGSGGSGYTKSKYSVQMFFTTPHEDSQKWSDIYHKEYVPKGAEGDEGVWGGSKLLDDDSDDRVRNTNAYESDYSWAVAPSFSDFSLTGSENVRMTLNLWYYRGTSTVTDGSGKKDRIKLRASMFESDVLVYSPGLSAEVAPEEQDLKNCTVLGVIEGTPPFPVNKGLSGVAPSLNLSTVEFLLTDSNETSTTWTAGGTIAVSMGKTFGKVGCQAKLTSGLTHTKTLSKSSTYSYYFSHKSFTHETPGDTGIVLILKPHIINSAYVLHSYNYSALDPDSSLLHYDGYESSEEDDDVLRMSLITYGDKTIIEPYPYKLQDPTSEFSYAEFFAGMKERPLSTDVAAWKTELDSSSAYATSYALPVIPGAISTDSKLTISKTKTTAETTTKSAGFSSSASFLGFGFQTDCNYKMDLTTKTSMSLSLGFYYCLRECDAATECCIDKVDVAPYILSPKESASGYNAPWITDDIRAYSKPKPWAISYITHPSQCRSGNSTTSSITLAAASGSLTRDLTTSRGDHVSADFILSGLGADFSLKSMSSQALVHLRMGNHIFNTSSHRVVSRGFQGKTYVVKLRERGNSKSAITIKLLHDKKNSLLKVHLNGKQINLAQLFENYSLKKYQAGTMPFRLFTDGDEDSQGNLGAYCTVRNREKIKYDFGLFMD